jgi:ArsR family transcriptional regulator, lead/cadmium/zinc/bismuth-responsive transcriptional repressor
MIIYKKMIKKRSKDSEPEERCGLRVLHRERIEKAHREASPEKETNRLAAIYKVLGDPTRLKMIMGLREGEMCVCDLAAFLGLTESAISHQLRLLRDQSLVKKRRDGQILYYSLDDDHVNDLLRVSLEHVREGRG